MGKTYGFGVPLLQRITTADQSGGRLRPLDGTPRALIIVPTRELCLQVTGDLQHAAKYLTSGDRKFEVLSIYGGRPYETQIDALRKGVDVVSAHPADCSTWPNRAT